MYQFSIPITTFFSSEFGTVVEVRINAKSVPGKVPVSTGLTKR